MSGPVIIFAAVAVIFVIPNHDAVKGICRTDHGQSLENPKLGKHAESIDDDHKDRPQKYAVAACQLSSRYI